MMSGRSVAGLGPFFQIGYVVADLDTAVRAWIENLGIGPWTVFRNVTLVGTYQTAETQIVIDVALGYRGDIQIELITPTTLAPSPYRADDGTLREGLHHLAWLVENIEPATDALRAGGLEVEFAGGNAASQVAYLVMPAIPGTRFELIESPATAQMFREGVAISNNWDGSNPVTEIDFTVG